MSARATQWCAIEMLPVIFEQIEAEFAQEKQQLDALSAIKEKPYYLSKEVAEKIKTSYSEKVTQRYYLQEQCRNWRTLQPLSDLQKTTLTALEKILTESNKLSQQLLFFVEHFQQNKESEMSSQNETDLTKQALALLTTEDKALIVTIDEKVEALRRHQKSQQEILVALFPEMTALQGLIHKTTGHKSALEFYYEAYPGFMYFMQLLSTFAQDIATEKANKNTQANA